MADELDTTALTSRERAALKRARSASTLLDEAIRIPVIGYRIGIDPILGILPISGDAVGAALSLYIVAEAARLDAPRKTLARMMVNIGVDAVGGSIPILGNLFDVFWKANERNVSLLESHLEKRIDSSVE
jgi:hypothetical protein